MLSEEGEYYHKKYAEGEVKQKKYLQQRLQELFQQDDRILSQPAESIQALQEKIRKLEEANFVLQAENKNVRASTQRLYEELSGTKK